MYLKGNKKLDILRLYLGGYAKQFYLREISALTRIPLRTTQMLLSALEKENILRGTLHGKNKYFRLNLDTIQTKFYLLQAELHQTLLFLQKYPSLKTFLKSLETPSLILVFGSFAKLTAGKDSDLDLLIVSNKRLPEKLPLHLIPYRIHDIRMTADAFAKAIDAQETLIKEIEDHHVILTNHSSYVNSMWGHNGA